MKGDLMTTPDLGDLTCKEVVELVTDYLEGALPVEMRQRFDQHLTGCDPCIVYVDQMRQTIAESIRAEAKRETLLEQIRLRFKQVPSAIETKIEATADIQQLDAWLKAFATARRLSDIPFDVEE